MAVHSLNLHAGRRGSAVFRRVGALRAPIASPRNGAAVVEFAVVLPLLVLVLFGIWEVGQMLQVRQILANAAREGARQAAAGHRTNNEVRDVVLRYMQHAGVPTANATIVIENLTDPPNTDVTQAHQADHIRVTVSVPFSDVQWVPVSRTTEANAVMGSATWCSLKDKEFPNPGDGGIE